MYLYLDVGLYCICDMGREIICPLARGLGPQALLHFYRLTKLTLRFDGDLGIVLYLLNSVITFPEYVSSRYSSLF
jgi:hypothetical protein